MLHMDEPWKLAKWNYVVTKERIFYDSIYMQYPE